MRGEQNTTGCEPVKSHTARLQPTTGGCGLAAGTGHERGMLEGLGRQLSSKEGAVVSAPAVIG